MYPVVYMRFETFFRVCAFNLFYARANQNEYKDFEEMLSGGARISSSSLGLKAAEKKLAKRVEKKVYCFPVLRMDPVSWALALLCCRR